MSDRRFSRWTHRGDPRHTEWLGDRFVRHRHVSKKFSRGVPGARFDDEGVDPRTVSRRAVQIQRQRGSTTIPVHHAADGIYAHPQGDRTGAATGGRKESRGGKRAGGDVASGHTLHQRGAGKEVAVQSEGELGAGGVRPQVESQLQDCARALSQGDHIGLGNFPQGQ